MTHSGEAIAGQGGGGMSRRDVLRFGGVAALAGLGGAASAAGNVRPAPGRARSCLLVFLAGGPSHIDSLDPKPDAPEEVRGEFRPIATAIPGLYLCEHLPRLARLADKFTLLRALNHEDARHADAIHRMLTGRALAGPPGRCEGATPEDYPHLGSALAAALGDPSAGMPAFVAVPEALAAGGPVRAGQLAGRLGRHFDPTMPHVGPDRDEPRPWRPSPRGQTFGAGSPLGAALDLTDEPDRVRDRYGRDRFGQSVLLGHRLIEAGARFVQINWVRRLDPGWDAHGAIFATMRDDLLPTLDRALSALLDDLSASGRLDETLVLVLGEFGRSPRVTPGCAGREHWPSVFSGLAAGAGLPGGRAFGASDKQGAYPVDRPVTPGRLAATIAHALGVDPSAEVPTLRGAPHAISDEPPVLELWA